MKEDLLKIIEHYGVIPQLKYFQSEVFELNEAIIEKEHIDNGELHEIGISKDYYWAHVCEEIADCYVMLEQLRHYYDISDGAIKHSMELKIKRQLERIKNEGN
mgnify:CR=1 FL=1